MTTVGSVIKTNLTQICMFFFNERYIRLGCHIFNETLGYYTILEFGPIGGYLCRLNSKIKGEKIHNINIAHHRSGEDLINALAF